MNSVALSTAVHEQLRAELLRPDGQEDIRFALWRPSAGALRTSALLRSVIEPRAGDRQVHGNASFTGTYVERALDAALAQDSGIAVLHSHPAGSGWQGMSPADRAAEAGLAGSIGAATGLPLVGLTMAGTGELSARWWMRRGPRLYLPDPCATVRTVGGRLNVMFNPAVMPVISSNPRQARSVAAWGEETQSIFARLRVGIVGLGSVGSIVAEAVARTGIRDIRLIDFDTVRVENLDRLLHATRRDALERRAKVQVMARALAASATAIDPVIEAFELAVSEESGFRRALDCDVLLSCVDRPWARSVLNFIAYAHLIPVIDGGVHVRSRRGRRLVDADWRGHTAAPGRRCLACLKQFDPGLVAAEREGLLDRPSYIDGLSVDHPLRANENVFAFALGAASLQMEHLIAMVAEPSGISDLGALHMHLASGEFTRDERGCDTGCGYMEPTLIAAGDRSGLTVTGAHAGAEAERNYRSHAAKLTIWDRLGDLRTMAASVVGR